MMIALQQLLRSISRGNMLYHDLGLLSSVASTSGAVDSQSHHLKSD